MKTRFLFAAAALMSAGVVYGKAEAAITYSCGYTFTGMLTSDSTQNFSDSATNNCNYDYTGHAFDDDPIAEIDVNAVADTSALQLHFKTAEVVQNPSVAKLSATQTWSFTLDGQYYFTYSGYSNTSVPGQTNPGLKDPFGNTPPSSFDTEFDASPPGPGVKLLGPGTYSFTFFNPSVNTEDEFEVFAKFTPAVPLPAAAWLLLSGIGGLATVARRKRVR